MKKHIFYRRALVASQSVLFIAVLAIAVFGVVYLLSPTPLTQLGEGYIFPKS